MPNGPVDVAAGAPNPESYTDNGDGTVTDNVTGLMWQQEVPGTYTWEGAMAYCPKLTLANHSGWRLPSLIELVSIVDPSVQNPSINSTVFPHTPATYFWSSTPLPGWTESGWFGPAWFVYFVHGGTNFPNYNKPYTYYVRCVR